MSDDVTGASPAPDATPEPPTYLDPSQQFGAASQAPGQPPQYPPPGMSSGTSPQTSRRLGGVTLGAMILFAVVFVLILVVGIAIAVQVFGTANEFGGLGDGDTVTTVAGGFARFAA